MSPVRDKVAERLDPYRRKRDFARSPEPEGLTGHAAAATDGDGIFVIHKHAARRLHYDLRLEAEGVLWSWAVTRGPSLDPDEKRLAVHVEDHPLDYATFEGIIPSGYGAGTVIVWDRGRWHCEGSPAAGLAKGHLSFTLAGEKLRGQWHLVRLKPRAGERRDNWLLMKVRDDDSRAEGDILEQMPASVATGLTIEEVAAGQTPARAPRKLRGAKTSRLRDARTRQQPDEPDASPAPTFVEPCLATLQVQPPAGPDWVHEVKFDGYRLQARIEDGTVTLRTRTGLDWTHRFGSAITQRLGKLPCRDALIDGEAVVLGEQGIASFSALQAALSENRTSAIVFYAFDLLHLDGVPLLREPLLERKARLQALLAEEGDDGPVRFSEHFSEPGQTLLRHACRMGLEGMMSKRADAPYRSGRGRDWIKSKCTQRQEFVIGGYAPSQASRNALGSLVVGYHEEGRLIHAGRVGTGFSRKAGIELKRRLDAMAVPRSPFAGKAMDERGVVWVRPELVAEVAFRAWTASRTLRHASFLGLREDKPADEVVAETPVAANPPPAAARKATSRAKAPAAAAETTVRLSSPDKALWPKEGLTKQDLLAYYTQVWPLMQPFVVDRPLSLVRAPDGIEGHHFFQKHAMPGMHKAIRTHRDSDGEELLYISDFDGLAGLVQLGVVEIHAWGARIDDIERPDQMVFDLDPDTGIGIDVLREATREVRDRLQELGFRSWLKTSGGKGFHVVVPITPGADWARVKGFARDFAKALEQAAPRRFTATLSKAARYGRIFIDYLRNGRGATAIVPYSTRGRPGAAIAAPVPWTLLEEGLTPDRFKARTLLASGPEQELEEGNAEARTRPDQHL